MKSVLKALVICAAGGVLFSALRAPLPWMLGPLLAMAFGKFLGADLASPKGGRATGQLIIGCALGLYFTDRKSTRLNSSHSQISYAVFCLKKKKKKKKIQ